MPLIYSGRKEPELRAIKFLDKDTVRFKRLAGAYFYKTLIALQKNNAALAPDAAFNKIHAGDDNAIYTITRQKAGKKSAGNFKFFGKAINHFAYR